MILQKDFYQQNTIKIAKMLLGTYLVSRSVDGTTVGKIVETECYLGKNDPASHSFKGETKRNAPMFGEPGHAYIYFIYGMHYCFNVTTGPKGVGEAVLIRALEPIEGIDLMKKRRGVEDIYNLCNGPAKLTQALGITSGLNGSCLIKGPIQILSRNSYPEIHILPKNPKIVVTKRVGISQATDLPLRFYLKDNKFISKK